jgi:hypothetical protein
MIDGSQSWEYTPVSLNAARQTVAALHLRRWRTVAGKQAAPTRGGANGRVPGGGGGASRPVAAKGRESKKPLGKASAGAHVSVAAG